MFDRIRAKEKAKTIIRTRSFADFIGMILIFAATAGVMFLFIPFLPFIVMNLGAVIFGFNFSYFIGLSIFGIVMLVCITLIVLLVIGALNLLFHAGMNRSALRIIRGDKTVRVLDVALAGDRLSRYISITLWQILFLFLWNLPSAAAVAIALILWLGGIVSNTAAAFAVILTIAAYAWSIYISINKFCQYYFAYFIAEDNREMAALDCIRESGSLMVDHKWEMFVTIFSFIGWDIFSVLPFAIGFTSPYKYLTYAYIYEQLNNQFKPISHNQMPWLQNGPIQSKEASERMVEILSGEFAGASLPVKAGEDITIGRDPKRANVVTSPENTTISGLHCRIRYDEQNGKYIVVDHSSNGTYLNNEKLMQEKGTYAAKGSLVKLADGAMILRLS